MSRFVSVLASRNPPERKRSVLGSTASSRCAINHPPTDNEKSGSFLLDFCDRAEAQSLPKTRSGYKRLFECDKPSCGKKFFNYKLLTDHYRKCHPAYKRVSYKAVVCNGSYIKQQLKGCCKESIVWSHGMDDPCQHEKTSVIVCYNRICGQSECMTRRFRRYKRKWREKLKYFQQFSFLSVTMNKNMPYSQNKKDAELLIRNFIKRVQRLPELKKYRIQYVRVTEFKTGYHFHYVVDMPYVKQDILRDKWLSVTKGTSIELDIQRPYYIRNGKKITFWVNNGWRSLDTILNYVGKYLSKPMPTLDHDEYARVIYGKQLSYTRIDKNVVAVHEFHELLVSLRGVVPLLDIGGQSSSIFSPRICPICHDKLRHMTIIDTLPPPH